MVCLLCALAGVSFSCLEGPARTGPATSPITSIPSLPREYGYYTVARYPHDPRAFTEGLVYDNGVLYEGTGMTGQSSLRRVELKTGEVEQIVQLPPPFFGEGVAVFGDRVFQLTWRSNVGFVYDKATFLSLRRFNYNTEGWGLTTDGKSLIMSDGTRTLYYLDPSTLEVTGNVEVKGGPATIPDMRLNELEYVKGEIFANVWPTDFILRIDPESGEVVGWANLAGMLNSDEKNAVDVLNGIAYDFVDDKLFVTGKYWPTLFEIKLVPKN